MTEQSVGGGNSAIRPPSPHPNPNTTTYTIAVKTSDVRNAGTDANVYVQVTGTEGLGPQVQLKTSLNHRNKFERKHSDVFVFHDQKPLGELKQLKIWHDNSGIGPGWHLQVVEVNDASNGKSYVFPCNQWLDKKEGDKQLVRILTCSRVKERIPKQLRIAAEMAKQQPQTGTAPGQQMPAAQGQQQWSHMQMPPGQQHGQQQPWPGMQQWAQQPSGQGSQINPSQSFQYKATSPTRIKMNAQPSPKSTHLDSEEQPTSKF